MGDTMSLRKSFAVAVWCSTLVGAAFVSKAAASVPTTGLIGYWKGDGNALDYSTKGNNGSFPGSYTRGQQCHLKVLNLATGTVQIPNNSAYEFENYSGWTVGFWFNANPSSINTGNAFFLGQDNGEGYQNKWEIEYGYSVYTSNSTGAFELHLNDPQQLRIFIPSNQVAFPSGWNQLTVVWKKKPGTVSFYLNGESIGTDSYGGIIPYPSANLVFGYAEPGLNYTGLLDNVVIYKRALSATQVVDLAKPRICADVTPK
jgi:Concanavalin A-like lectin/glucanases superfamily